MNHATACLAFVLSGLASAAAQAEPAPDDARVRCIGRVVGWEGQPIAGAAVAWADPDTLSTAELLQQPPVTTDADGRFEFTAWREPGTRERNFQVLIAAKGRASVARSVPWKYEPKRDQRAPSIRAAETDLGQIVLAEGVRLFGRVRAASGEPLAGARVVARDLLDGSRTLPGAGGHGFRCVAISDGRGIFELPTTLAQGVSIDVALDGHYRRTIEPVAVGTPLEIELRKSGSIRGRLLDETGSGVGGATVSASYERRGPTTRTETEPDGSFTLPLEYDARYRLNATHTRPVGEAPADGKPQQKVTVRGRSGILQGPLANLELSLKAPDAEQKKDATSERMRVRAVDAASGDALGEFRVAAVWEDYANQNANYLEYRMQHAMPRELQRAEDGALEITGPGEHNARTGIVRVLAPGYAPATVRDVEWKDVDAGKEREALVVQLHPEAGVTGRVVDETSGEGIAGVKVWARPQLDPNQGSYGDPYGGKAPPDAVETAADGSFAIGQLGEGAWHLRCEHEKRPPMPPESVELKAAERRGDVVLKLPLGAEVAGRVVGMPIPEGTKVFLHELPRTTFGNSGSYTSYRGGIPIPNTAIALDQDGAFSFTGVKLENYLLVLVLPSRPRCGDPLCIPLEPFRVRKDGIARDFDAAEDRPATISGRVTFPAASVPLDRLAVVAQQVAEDPNMPFYGNHFAGTRSFVAPDATFAIHVAPGSYRLRLIDYVSGLPLATPPATLRVRPSQTVQSDLKAPLTEVTLRLVPEQADGKVALTDRVEVRFQAKNGQQMGFGNDNYDSGTGLPIEPGQREVRLQLPPGNATFLLRNNVTQLRVDDQRYNVPPVGRHELEVPEQAKAPLECEIKVGPPPEIPDPDAKPEGQQGKGDDAVQVLVR